jgi:FKBP-type peptidyl-prolyl cis-trans isomerase FkpA
MFHWSCITDARRRPRLAPGARTGVALAAALALTAIAGSAGAQTAPAQPAPAATAAPAASLSAKIGANVTQLQKIDVKEGTGAEVVAGNPIIVHYTGWLYDPAAPDGHGKQFDSSRGKTPFGFIVARGKVIKGWDEGVLGMKIGGQRTLVIPANMAYGERGAGGVIPPNATLIFDIELLDIRG